MKTLVVLTLVAAAGIVALTYVTTGEVALWPRRLSPEETQLRSLERRFEAARRQVAQAGRAAGLTGADASAAVAAAQREVERIRVEAESLMARLHHSALDQAAEARQGAARRLERVRAKVRERAEKLKKAVQAFERELR